MIIMRLSMLHAVHPAAVVFALKNHKSHNPVVCRVSRIHPVAGLSLGTTFHSNLANS